MSDDRLYQETIDYLYGLQKHGVKLGLSNTVALMKIAGDPHRAFRSIHVAGTNGKGSTCAFIASILMAAGYRVGLYTSPHLVSFTERIRVNGIPIPEAKVVELAQRVRSGYRGAGADRENGMTPTFFEVATTLAFAYFAEERVDIAVVEVGMGGRLDSTNVITPLVSVITNIDLEHTEFLGSTLELIAAEKAGIIKPGIPVVTGAVNLEATGVMAREAKRLGAPFRLRGVDFDCEHVGAGIFDYRGMSRSYGALAISLLGRHQADNACLAVAAVECLRTTGVPVEEEAVRRGLERASWEGRLERVEERPDIYLDGAHNPASACVLAAAVRELKPAYRRLILVIGVLGDKDVCGILAPLVPLADEVVVTRPEYARALDSDILAAEVRSRHTIVDTAATVREAIKKAKEKAGRDDLILITGSLYVVGDARAALVAPLAASERLCRLKG